jgi:hypothetical protein
MAINKERVRKLIIIQTEAVTLYEYQNTLNKTEYGTPKNFNS